ncbi:uncharacterized protein LOC133501463 [Syngnathoides biaculeatus]|uniref:uncharacterized protein LOC133501463 n=1 Tax=Syngnathoides biaculeatus TaxID=300417 RepID=UPI002ADD5197|nr:uncharacterized protein LOC133501463 [Syngnathoides biaculeatus]XP_061677234.1 uncharacterized protein LOC133501463 [Syngnathoides biaculeatus]
MTEGDKLEQVQRLHIRWKSSTQDRTQGDYTCPAYRACGVVNVTSNCQMWKCKRCLGGKDIPVVEQGCNLTVISVVPMCHYNRTTKTCNEHNWTRWTITVKETVFFFFFNSTEISGRNTFLYLIWVLPGKPNATRTHIAPVLDTCTHMAQARVKTRVYWEIKFPDIPHCTRRRKAWYDTLLGGMGTLYGVANAADNEVTRTMLSNTGQRASEPIHQVGVWLPKAMIGQLENTDVWKKAFTWELKLWSETYDALKNLSHIGNWTNCALQMIHAEAQKERFQRIMTTGNYHEWRRVWNISSKLWLQLHSERTKCKYILCWVLDSVQCVYY